MNFGSIFDSSPPLKQPVFVMGTGDTCPEQLSERFRVLGENWQSEFGRCSVKGDSNDSFHRTAHQKCASGTGWC